MEVSHSIAQGPRDLHFEDDVGDVRVGWGDGGGHEVEVGIDVLVKILYGPSVSNRTVPGYMYTPYLASKLFHSLEPQLDSVRGSVFPRLFVFGGYGNASLFDLLEHRPARIGRRRLLLCFGHR